MNVSERLWLVGHAENFSSRLAMLAVQTVNRNVKTRMLVTFPFHHVVLRLAEEAVLRTKKR